MDIVRTMRARIILNAKTYRCDRTNGARIPHDRDRSSLPLRCSRPICQCAVRKLDSRYLEKNSKDEYIKSIISDIDDLPHHQSGREHGPFVARARTKKRRRTLRSRRQDRTRFRKISSCWCQLAKEGIDRAILLLQKIIDSRTFGTRIPNQDLQSLFQNRSFRIPG